MQAIEISAFGNPSVLTEVTLPDPVPAPGEVRLKVEAIGVGYQDVLARNGSLAAYGIKPGHIPGGEVAGVVDALGKGVDAAWLGRRAWTFTGLGGGYVSHAVVPPSELVLIPNGLSAVQAVAIGTAGVVAHFALDHAHFKSGETVLVRGAGGPLGIMTVQLAATRHAGVIAVTASNAERGGKLRGLGATHVLDRAGTASDQANGEFDIIIDVVAGPNAAAFLKRLKPGGRMVMIGAVAGPPADVAAAMFADFQRSLSFSMFSANLIPINERRRITAELLCKATRGDLQTVVADTLSLNRAADAHTRLEMGGVFGRIVLIP